MLVNGAEQPPTCADEGRRAKLAVHVYVYKATVYCIAENFWQGIKFGVVVSITDHSQTIFAWGS